MSPSARAILPAVFLVSLGCSVSGKPASSGNGEVAARTVEVKARVSAVLRGSDKVAIDAGRDRGIVVGTNFRIYRKGEMIGTVQTTAVWATECAGTVVKGRKPVLPGDEASALVLLDAPGAQLRPEAPSTRPASRPGTIRASVIAVREKPARVVLDAGARQGVKAGKVFYLYRGDSYIGRVKVTLVKPGMSGAEIIEQRVKIGLDCRAVFDPEDERRDAGKTMAGRTDLDSMIRDVEARIADPKTSPEDRKAAREILVRLRKEKAAAAKK